MPARLVNSRKHARCEGLLSGCHKLIRLVSSLGVRIVSRIRRPTVLQSNSVIYTTSSFMDGCTSVLRIEDISRLFAFLISGYRRTVGRFSGIFGKFSLGSAPCRRITGCTSSLVRTLFPRKRSVSEGFDKGRISHVGFRRRGTTASLVE